MRDRLFFVFLCFCVTISCHLAYAEKTLNIEYILDSSSSMNEPLANGEKKIDVAKKVLCGLIDNISAESSGNVNVGLRIYGANFQPTDTKEKACLDSILYVPINGINVASLKENINRVTAAGLTPIAHSLELAGKDFSPIQGNVNTIVLVTDGEETCGGDPAGTVKNLREQGLDVTVHVIGFAVDEKAKMALEQIALASGGSYYTADNTDQLMKSLTEIKQRAFEQYSAFGADIKPSNWISTAPEITEGDYKGALDMQSVNFYKMKAYKGQIVKASLIVKKTPYQASNNVVFQTFSLGFFTDHLQNVASDEIIVEGNPEEISSFKTEWTVDKTGWLYIAVAASKNHNEIRKPVSLYPENAKPNPSEYTLKVKIKGEKEIETPEPSFVELLSKDLPGGTGFEKTGECAVNEYANGTIYMKETRFYKVPVQKEIKNISINALVRKPWYNADNGEINMTYTLKVYDEDCVELSENSIRISDNPSLPVGLNIDIQAGDNKELYISLTASDNHNYLGKGNSVSVYPKTFQPDSTKYSLIVN